MTHMLPTRPASGLTCPSFVFVPQAQHALQTPSQQAQAAQQAREATQPIFFCSRLVLTRVDGVQHCLCDITACHCLLLYASTAYKRRAAKCDLCCVVCPWTARMRFFSRRRERATTGNTRRLCCCSKTRARSQTGRFFSGPGACAAN